MANNYGLVEKK